MRHTPLLPYNPLLWCTAFSALGVRGVLEGGGDDVVQVDNAVVPALGDVEEVAAPLHALDRLVLGGQARVDLGFGRDAVSERCANY